VGDPSRSALFWEVGNSGFECGTEGGEVEFREMRVGKENVGGRFESRKDGLDDVRNEVETTMDRFTAFRYEQERGQTAL
jgi:hypothetical protein